MLHRRGLAKLTEHTVRAAPMPYERSRRSTARTRWTTRCGSATRSGLHTHGRALFTLVERACGERHETDYLMLEGELVAGIVLGWNFGDGHLHGEQLAAALQERCAFEPGEVRAVMLESQPIQRQAQRYRLVDAGRTGEVERGIRRRRRTWCAAQPSDPRPARSTPPVTP